MTRLTSKHEWHGNDTDLRDTSWYHVLQAVQSTFCGQASGTRLLRQTSRCLLAGLLSILQFWIQNNRSRWIKMKSIEMVDARPASRAGNDHGYHIWISFRYHLDVIWKGWRITRALVPFSYANWASFSCFSNASFESQSLRWDDETVLCVFVVSCRRLNDRTDRTSKNDGQGLPSCLYWCPQPQPKLCSWE